MSTRAVSKDPNLFRRWVAATTIGWLLGFALVIALAVVWDQIGGGAQFMVGVGMGIGVGLAQGRIVAEWGIRSSHWTLATAVGMGLPFVAWDLSAVVGIGDVFTLLLCVVLGGLLAGFFQGRLFGADRPRAGRWVLASLVGWGLPVALIAVGDSGILGGAGAVLPVAVMLGGGAVLGFVTGRALDGMHERSPG